MSQFPQLRLRRLRSTPATRSLVAEARVHPHDLIAPLFVVEGKAVRKPISSLPGMSHLSVDKLVAEAEALFKLGIPGIMLFGIPAAKAKTDDARLAWAKDGIVQRAVRALKKAVPGLLVFTDVCLCEYTSHGHCGLLEPAFKGGTRELRIANDPSLVALAKVAVSHAEAGADWVAPSDMMDGRVEAIRQALDGEGYGEVGILAYSAKFASAFYGPFREAAHSAPSFGDRRSHQMQPGNAREALAEMQLDYQEGADMLMVKPGLPYLDVIHEATERFDCPIVSYNVSGEYSMAHAAAAKGWGDLAALRDESLVALKRAGSKIIITYWARSFAEDYKKRAGLDHGF
jgi:porphobilinogen synthase